MDSSQSAKWQPSSSTDRLIPAIHRQAYTLIEVVIVILVMGIMAAVAVPRFSTTLNYIRVESAAKRIATDLNLVRKMAMTKGGMSNGEWATFYPATDKYRMNQDPDIDRPSQEYWVDLRMTYHVDLVSVDFANEGASPSLDTIKFDMYGSAASGNTPTRIVTGQIVVRSGSSQKTVVISRATGEASVQ